jgi:hypothetical protein
MNKKEHKYKAVFDYLDIAFDVFEKEHGKLNDKTDFDFYGEYMLKAVTQYNAVNGTDYEPSDVIDEMVALADNDKTDELMEYMNEATEGWEEFKAKQFKV